MGVLNVQRCNNCFALFLKNLLSNSLCCVNDGFLAKSAIPGTFAAKRPGADSVCANKGPLFAIS
jgi:hypothetical protein